MNIYELEKQATPGPVTAKHYLNKHDIPDADWRLFGDDHVLIGTVHVPYYGNKPRQQADKALLEHCRNHFMRAVEALKAHVEAQHKRGLPYDCIVGGELIAELEEV